jgi:Uma2 family endonuclease
MMNETTTNGFARPMPPTADPFFYGWRDVYRDLPDGHRVWEQIPLTEEDVLHPQEGDHIVQNSAHNRDCAYLKEVLAERLASDSGALVFQDMGVEWDRPELRHHSPDISVILGVRERKPYYSMFVVATEGVRPALIVEVTSPSTRNVDFNEKFQAYHRADVPLYVIVDRNPPDAPPRLIGYRHMPEGYAEFLPDDRGRLWLEPVRLWLGVQGDHVVCYDETGRELGDYTQISRELAAAQARAESEAQARADVEIRLRELEAELRRLRGEP